MTRSIHNKKFYVNYIQNYHRKQRINNKQCIKNIIKQKLKNVFTIKDLIHMADEYSQNSSLHGLRYVRDKNLHFTERLFWVASFLLAMFTSFYFITNLTNKWYEMPVIMSLSPKSVSITTLPFPAITICNMNNVRRTEAQRIFEKSRYDFFNIQRKLLVDFCNEDTLLGNTVEDNTTSTTWQAVEQFMIKVAQPCHEMILSCIWHGETQNCNEIFNAVLTDEGMCCSFNKINNDLIFRKTRDHPVLNVTFPYQSIDWSPETGFPNNTPITDLPWRPQGAGSHLGLTVTLDAELHEYYCASEASHGFKMTLHTPIETPKISGFGTLIRPGVEAQIIIKPTINKATPQLRNIHIEKRQCIFSNERTLRFYRTYSERNCMMECEANFTLYFCQCVMYYMPKDSLTRICGKKDIPCANRARLAMEVKLASNDTIWIDEQHAKGCGCLPSCFSIRYDSLKSSSDLSTNFYIKEEYTAKRNLTYFKNNMVVAHFFFTESEFTGIIKGEMFGFTEFLSSTGGLLGLFMGFSFLSAFEVLYFVTLRLWCSVRKRSSSEMEDKFNVNRKFQHNIFAIANANTNALSPVYQYVN